MGTYQQEQIARMNAFFETHHGPEGPGIAVQLKATAAFLQSPAAACLGSVSVYFGVGLGTTITAPELLRGVVLDSELGRAATDYVDAHAAHAAARAASDGNDSAMAALEQRQADAEQSLDVPALQAATTELAARRTHVERLTRDVAETQATIHAARANLEAVMLDVLTVSDSGRVVWLGDKARRVGGFPAPVYELAQLQMRAYALTGRKCFTWPPE